DRAGTTNVLHASPRRRVDLKILLHLGQRGLRYPQPILDATQIVEPSRRACEGDRDAPRSALDLAPAEADENTQGEQIARCVVECLAWQRHGMLGPGRSTALLGDTAHHLRGAVEAAPVRPRSRRAIGGEPADDEPGSQGSEPGCGVSQAAQGARSVAVDDDIRDADQALEGRPTFRRPE